MPIPLIIAGAAAIAAIAWAVDESNERERDRRRFREEIESLNARIAEQEAELRDLRKRFWRRSRQVRDLVDAIHALRDERDRLRKRLAA